MIGNTTSAHPANAVCNYGDSITRCAIQQIIKLNNSRNSVDSP